MNLSYLLHLFAKYGSPVLSVVERGIFKNREVTDSGQDIVFLVGPPRSGSTLIYQYLTNIYKVIYVDNLVDIFYRNPGMGIALSKWLFKDRPHNCYKSDLGNTRACGLHAPSESGRLWYRWFPKNSIESARIITATEAGIAHSLNNTITQTMLGYKQPLIFKNLMNVLRLQAISKIWPDARIISIKRDVIDTALSIREARLKANNDLEQWWSVAPPEYHDLRSRPWPEQVVGQILAIEKHIERDISLFEYHTEIAFETFKQSPEDAAREIWRSLQMEPARRKAANAISLRQKQSKNPSADREMLEKAYQKLRNHYA